jgi:hypothetical protein
VSAHAQAFPAPAVEVPDPGPEPKGFGEDWKDWHKNVCARRDYLRACRLHVVAEAVDRLGDKVAECSDAERIALMVGVAFLEADGRMGGGGLFGFGGMF